MFALLLESALWSFFLGVDVWSALRPSGLAFIDWPVVSWE
jgi:hypothetical protein